MKMASLLFLGLVVLSASADASSCFQRLRLDKSRSWVYSSAVSGNLTYGEAEVTFSPTRGKPVSFPVSSRKDQIWRGGVSSWTEYSKTENGITTTLSISTTSPGHVSIELTEGAVFRGISNYFCE